MTYEEFLQGIKWTENHWLRLSAGKTPQPQHSYESLRARGSNHWLHLETLSAAGLGQEIIDGFLNTATWNCHVWKPRSAEGAQVIQELQRAIHNASTYYGALRGNQLGNLNVLTMITIAGNPIPVSQVIIGVYEGFSQVRPRFGPVPSSKLMHMALPDLFMMWDNAIIRGYHVPQYRSILSGRPKLSYLPFLLLMDENARHIRSTSGTGLSMHWPAFLAYVRAQCGYSNLVTMTRLLDIANYAVGHPQPGAPAIRCRVCCERTNSILSQVESALTQSTGASVRLGRFKC